MSSRADRQFPEIPGQYGLATVAQLLGRGWTTTAMRQPRATRWQEAMPRVLAPHRGPLDGTTRLVAAGLWAGEKAVLTGGVALNRMGLKVARLSTATFVIPESSRARQHEAARCFRSARPVTVGGALGVVRFTVAARALADAAEYEEHTAADLEHLAISVLQRGLSSPEALEKELWQRPRRRVEPVWKGLAGFVDGAWSRPEVVLREIVDGDGGFPELITNCGLETLGGDYIGTPDGYFEEAGLAIQVHSRTFHQGIDDQGDDRWAGTVEKDSAFVAKGVPVIGVAPWTLYARPKRFLIRLREAVDLGLASPRPAVRVVPRRGEARRG